MIPYRMRAVCYCGLEFKISNKGFMEYGDIYRFTCPQCGRSFKKVVVPRKILMPLRTPKLNEG